MIDAIAFGIIKHFKIAKVSRVAEHHLYVWRGFNVNGGWKLYKHVANVTVGEQMLTIVIPGGAIVQQSFELADPTSIDKMLGFIESHSESFDEKWARDCTNH